MCWDTSSEKHHLSNSIILEISWRKNWFLLEHPLSIFTCHTWVSSHPYHHAISIKESIYHAIIHNYQYATLSRCGILQAPLCTTTTELHSQAYNWITSMRMSLEHSPKHYHLFYAISTFLELYSLPFGITMQPHMHNNNNLYSVIIQRNKYWF